MWLNFYQGRIQMQELTDVNGTIDAVKLFQAVVESGTVAEFVFYQSTCNVCVI